MPIRWQALSGEPCRPFPAPEMSFNQPNLPNLIREIETLIEKTLDG
jgi:hypothetical protein